MSIQPILSQLEMAYSKSNMNINRNDNIMFTSSFNLMDTLESLICRIKECQERALLGATPYTVPQVVNNTMHLFLQSGVFPMREFEAWDAVTVKTWPVLKTFVQGAYQRQCKLIASSIRTTRGQMGYAPNQNMSGRYSRCCGFNNWENVGKRIPRWGVMHAHGACISRSSQGMLDC